ncbi:hypothetical protein MW887_004987 [Aspergillus wentii]|nr:hypothetical protein MW887_004987 [Aspergillus wentii]
MLFSRIKCTNIEWIVSDDFLQFLSTPHVRHVRELTFIIGGDWLSVLWPNSEDVIVCLLNRRLVQCFIAMPNLTSFTFGEPMAKLTIREESEGVGMLPIYNKTLLALRQHSPRLRHLSITFPSSGDHLLDLEENTCDTESEEFKHYEQMTDVPSNLEGLVSTLVASPNLHGLALGLNDLAQVKDFFPRLCKSYAAAGGHPLLLKRLSFSRGCMPYSDEISHIPLLCDLDVLQSTYMSNEFTKDYTRKYLDFLCPEKQMACLALSDPSWCRSIRRISAKCLDDGFFSLIRRIGQDTTIAPHFMSEMTFTNCNFKDIAPKRFNIDPDKQMYWPRVFSVQYPARKEDIETCIHPVILEISGWRGLERLHFPSDIGNYEERKLISNLTKSLGQNLKVLSLYAPRKYPHTPFLPDKDFYCSLCLYEENCTTGERTIFDERDAVLHQDLEGSNRLRYAKPLCLDSNLVYLGIFDCYYRIYKDIVRDNDNRPFKVAWMQSVANYKADERGEEVFQSLFYGDLSGMPSLL